MDGSPIQLVSFVTTDNVPALVGVIGNAIGVSGGGQ